MRPSAPGSPRTVSRRAFLTRREPGAAEPGLIVGDTCLARRGVVCQTCRDACPEGAVRFPPLLARVALPVVDLAACTGCGACVEACPVGAIRMNPPPEEPACHER